MKNKLKFGFLISLLVTCSLVSVNCKDKAKTLVSAHNTIGNLLISTKNQVILYKQKELINEATYKNIKVNWERARKSYLDASDILLTVLNGNIDNMDILNTYLENITSVNNILNDIILWLEE